MATQGQKITRDWVKISNGDPAIIQNRGSSNLEVATVAAGGVPEVGFILRDYETFSFFGGEELWVRCRGTRTTVIFDKITSST